MNLVIKPMPVGLRLRLTRPTRQHFIIRGGLDAMKVRGICAAAATRPVAVWALCASVAVKDCLDGLGVEDGFCPVFQLLCGGEVDALANLGSRVVGQGAKSFVEQALE